MGTLLFFVAIIAAVGFWVVSVYNKLIRMIEAVQNNEKQIDIQLDRRFKVFESLIEVVKKYMDYEKSTLKEIVVLRGQAEQAKTDGDDVGRMAAENQISTIASGINVVFEQYPELKANTNAMQLQEEIVNTENKLSFSKQAFNDSIETYNGTKKQFFEAMICSVFEEKLDKDFDYWQLDKATVKAKEEYTVKLS